MAISFQANNHEYKSLDPADNIEWLGVTTFVSQFKPKFDAAAQALKSSRNKKSKWYGMDPVVIQQMWTNEGERGMGLGTFYHNQREADLVSLDSIQRLGRQIPIIKPLMEGDLKIAPSQNLTEGIYPEHMVYLKSAGICGQSDRVEVVNNTVDIYDYKTNKEIKLKGYTNWEGITSKMTGIMSHLDDCEFNHYALQLSLYMYIILKHNPKYNPGKLQIQHIIFERDGEDKFGYPITKLNENGDPIVKEIVPYDLPYLKDEVRSMINWLHEHPEVRKKKKH